MACNTFVTAKPLHIVYERGRNTCQDALSALRDLVSAYQVWLGDLAVNLYTVFTVDQEYNAPYSHLKSPLGPFDSTQYSAQLGG